MQAGNAEPYLKKGWAALVKDNDTAAIANFEKAHKIAVKENNVEDKAAALLNLGICYYGVSLSKGMEYASSAMEQYKLLEGTEPIKAMQGRSRCLQLISTIYGRQGKFEDAITLSREAIRGFPVKDSNGYLGLAYSSLGSAYNQTGHSDSSEFYYYKALQAQLLARNFVYLPGAYVQVANIESKKGNYTKSLQLLRRAMFIADSSGNRQAQVSVWLGIGAWHQQAKHSTDSAEWYFQKAKTIASDLNDKVFYLKTLERLFNLKKETGEFSEALKYREEIARIKDSLNSLEAQKLNNYLEVQFNVAEKDRQLQLLQQEKNITLLSNYLLWGAVATILIISTGIILFMRRINNRNKLLLQTKEALVKALEEQKNIREQFLQNELEFKESQLSAMALQILQKNELMNEIKELLKKENLGTKTQTIDKLIGTNLNYEKEWADFNTYFESVNKNFYTKLKNDYPDISPNDLKICALIKLNLSIKEMAGVLNISPDSVKTARHRLRKRLQLNNEDNLTEFIMKL